MNLRPRHGCRILGVMMAGLILQGCRPGGGSHGPAAAPGEPPAQEWLLLEGELAASWKQSGIPDEGRIAVQGEVLRMETGQPMTGATFNAWKDRGLPSSGYSIHYEARRLEGEDFFGTVTFPVGDSAASFVLGGWGGTVTGISSLDFSDANENQTRAEQRFENGRWYRVKVHVQAAELRAWVEDRLVVNVSIKGRKVGLRPGFIDHCLPFGFATYGTTAEIRKVRIRRL